MTSAAFVVWVRAAWARLIGGLRPQRSWGFWVVLSLLILAPQVFSGPSKLFGLPRINSGDEPHYLIQIKSLVRDGDLNVANNYAWAARGADDAGERFRWRTLDPHVLAYQKGKAVSWHEVYDIDRWKDKWGELPANAPLRDGVRKIPNFRYSWHPDGLAVILAPVWLVIRDSPLLEPAVVFCSGIAALIMLLFFERLLRVFTDDVWTIRAAAVLTFLGTPVWHYSRSIFTEVYLATCAVAAFSLAFRARSRWLLGIPVALGFLLKPTFPVIALPLLFFLPRTLAAWALCGAAPLLALGYTLTMNTLRYGSPLRFCQSSHFSVSSSIADRLYEMTIQGLLPYVPVAVLALFGWPHLVRQNPSRAWAVVAGVLLYLVPFALLPFSGGHCFGPRYMVPVIPLIMLGIVSLPRMALARYFWPCAIATFVAVLSIQINALGALPYWRFWGRHPLEGLF